MQGKTQLPHEKQLRKVSPDGAQPCTPPESRDFFEGFRDFIGTYPRYWRQKSAPRAYAFALTRISHDDLMVAVRKFAAHTLEAKPDGWAWRYCPSPEKWLGEERYRQYLNGEKQ